MTCSDNTYYVGNTRTLIYIILICLNAMFMLFTAITHESFTNKYQTNNLMYNY